jgi:hypothetical protein
MAVHPGEFTPKSAEESGSGRRFHAHQNFNSLAISLAVDETTDTTYPVEKVGILTKGIKLTSFFDPAMDITDYRRYAHYPFILQLQLKMNRLR